MKLSKEKKRMIRRWLKQDGKFDCPFQEKDDKKEFEKNYCGAVCESVWPETIGWCPCQKYGIEKIRQRAKELLTE